MKKFELTSVTSPSIEFECAGEVVQSDVIKDTKKNPNFEKPVLTRMIVVITPIFILSTSRRVTCFLLLLLLFLYELTNKRLTAPFMRSGIL